MNRLNKTFYKFFKYLLNLILCFQLAIFNPFLTSNSYSQKVPKVNNQETSSSGETTEGDDEFKGYSKGYKGCKNIESSEDQTACVTQNTRQYMTDQGMNLDESGHIRAGDKDTQKKLKDLQKGAEYLGWVTMFVDLITADIAGTCASSKIAMVAGLAGLGDLLIMLFGDIKLREIQYDYWKKQADLEEKKKKCASVKNLDIVKDLDDTDSKIEEADSSDCKVTGLSEEEIGNQQLEAFTYLQAELGELIKIDKAKIASAAIQTALHAGAVAAATVETISMFIPGGQIAACMNPSPGTGGLNATASAAATVAAKSASSKGFASGAGSTKSSSSVAGSSPKAKSKTADNVQNKKGSKEPDNVPARTTSDAGETVPSRAVSKATDIVPVPTRAVSSAADSVSSRAVSNTTDSVSPNTVSNVAESVPPKTVETTPGFPSNRIPTKPAPKVAVLNTPAFTPKLPKRDIVPISNTLGTKAAAGNTPPKIAVLNTPAFTPKLPNRGIVPISNTPGAKAAAGNTPPKIAVLNTPAFTPKLPNRGIVPISNTPGAKAAAGNTPPKIAVLNTPAFTPKLPNRGIVPISNTPGAKAAAGNFPPKVAALNTPAFQPKLNKRKITPDSNAPNAANSGARKKVKIRALEGSGFRPDLDKGKKGKNIGENKGPPEAIGELADIPGLPSLSSSPKVTSIAPSIKTDLGTPSSRSLDDPQTTRSSGPSAGTTKSPPPPPPLPPPLPPKFVTKTIPTKVETPIVPIKKVEPDTPIAKVEPELPIKKVEPEVPIKKVEPETPIAKVEPTKTEINNQKEFDLENDKLQLALGKDLDNLEMEIAHLKKPPTKGNIAFDQKKYGTRGKREARIKELESKVIPDRVKLAETEFSNLKARKSNNFVSESPKKLDGSYAKRSKKYKKTTNDMNKYISETGDVRAALENTKARADFSGLFRELDAFHSNSGTLKRLDNPNQKTSKNLVELDLEGTSKQLQKQKITSKLNTADMAFQAWGAKQLGVSPTRILKDDLQISENTKFTKVETDIINSEFDLAIKNSLDEFDTGNISALKEKAGVTSISKEQTQALRNATSLKSNQGPSSGFKGDNEFATEILYHPITGKPIVLFGETHVKGKEAFEAQDKVLDQFNFRLSEAADGSGGNFKGISKERANLGREDVDYTGDADIFNKAVGFGDKFEGTHIEAGQAYYSKDQTKNYKSVINRAMKDEGVWETNKNEVMFLKDSKRQVKTTDDFKALRNENIKVDAEGKVIGYKKEAIAKVDIENTVSKNLGDEKLGGDVRLMSTVRNDHMAKNIFDKTSAKRFSDYDEGIVLLGANHLPDIKKQLIEKHGFKSFGESSKASDFNKTLNGMANKISELDSLSKDLRRRGLDSTQVDQYLVTKKARFVEWNKKSNVDRINISKYNDLDLEITKMDNDLFKLRNSAPPYLKRPKPLGNNFSGNADMLAASTPIKKTILNDNKVTSRKNVSEMSEQVTVTKGNISLVPSTKASMASKGPANVEFEANYRERFNGLEPPLTKKQFESASQKVDAEVKKWPENGPESKTLNIELEGKKVNVLVYKDGTSFARMPGFELGEGGFKTVYTGTNLKTGELVAYSEVDFKNSGDIDIKQQRAEFNAELDVTNKLNGLNKNGEANLATFTHATEAIGPNGKKKFIIVSKMMDGDASDLALPGRSPEFDNQLAISKQAINSLDFMHKKGMVHRDIKLENFLYKKNIDGKIDIEVADFGLTKNIDDVKLEKTQDVGHGKESVPNKQGTLSHMDPAIFDKSVDLPDRIKLEKNDVFATGIALAGMNNKLKADIKDFKKANTEYTTKFGDLDKMEADINASKKARDGVYNKMVEDFDRLSGAEKIKPENVQTKLVLDMLNPDIKARVSMAEAKTRINALDADVNKSHQKTGPPSRSTASVASIAPSTKTSVASTAPSTKASPSSKSGTSSKAPTDPYQSFKDTIADDTKLLNKGEFDVLTSKAKSLKKDPRLKDLKDGEAIKTEIELGKDKVLVEVTTFKEGKSFAKMGNYFAEGGFKKVYKSVDLDTGKVYAHSVFNKGADLAELKKEMKIMDDLKGGPDGKTNMAASYENFTTVKNADGTKSQVMIAELFDGSLLNSIDPKSKSPIILNGKQKLEASKQMVDSIEFMHKKGYMHNDIKPENFLINKKADGSLDVRAADFGGVLNTSKQSNSLGSYTPSHRDPNIYIARGMTPDGKVKVGEVDLSRKQILEASDVYSLGISLGQINGVKGVNTLTASTTKLNNLNHGSGGKFTKGPMASPDDVDTKNLVNDHNNMKKNYDSLSEAQKNLSENRMTKLVIDMTNPNLSKRISMDEVQTRMNDIDAGKFSTKSLAEDTPNTALTRQKETVTKQSDTNNTAVTKAETNLAKSFGEENLITVKDKVSKMPEPEIRSKIETSIETIKNNSIRKSELSSRPNKTVSEVKELKKITETNKMLLAKTEFLGLMQNQRIIKKNKVTVELNSQKINKGTSKGVGKIEQPDTGALNDKPFTFTDAKKEFSEKGLKQFAKNSWGRLKESFKIGNTKEFLLKFAGMIGKESTRVKSKKNTASDDPKDKTEEEADLAEISEAKVDGIDEELPWPKPGWKELKEKELKEQIIVQRTEKLDRLNQVYNTFLFRLDEGDLKGNEREALNFELDNIYKEIKILEQKAQKDKELNEKEIDSQTIYRFNEGADPKKMMKKLTGMIETNKQMIQVIKNLFPAAYNLAKNRIKIDGKRDHEGRLTNVKTMEVAFALDLEHKMLLKGKVQSPSLADYEQYKSMNQLNKKVPISFVHKALTFARSTPNAILNIVFPKAHGFIDKVVDPMLKSWETETNRDKEYDSRADYDKDMANEKMKAVVQTAITILITMLLKKIVAAIGLRTTFFSTSPGILAVEAIETTVASLNLANAVIEMKALEKEMGKLADIKEALEDVGDLSDKAPPTGGGEGTGGRGKKRPKIGGGGPTNRTIDTGRNAAGTQYNRNPLGGESCVAKNSEGGAQIDPKCDCAQAGTCYDLAPSLEEGANNVVEGVGLQDMGIAEDFSYLAGRMSSLATGDGGIMGGDVSNFGRDLNATNSLNKSNKKLMEALNKLQRKEGVDETDMGIESALEIIDDLIAPEQPSGWAKAFKGSGGVTVASTRPPVAMSKELKEVADNISNAQQTGGGLSRSVGAKKGKKFKGFTGLENFLQKSKKKRKGKHRQVTSKDMKRFYKGTNQISKRKEDSIFQILTHRYRATGLKLLLEKSK